jgi:ATP-dependent helicase/nuclease subunit A
LPDHEAAELPFLQAEVTRLLYVAATRARQMLVISRQSPPKGTPAWGVLNEYLGDAKEIRIPTNVEISPVVSLTCSVAAQAAADSARIAASGAVNRASWSITSVTAEAKHIAKMATSAAPATDGDATRVVAQTSSSHRADAGMAWGTLIHGLLEHAMRHKGATREDLRRLAMWLTVEEPQLRPVTDEALDTVERAARADFWQIATERAHSVETPFTTADSRRLTNGVIDLIFESDGGWRVVDYKTDQTTLPGRHDRQLEAYRSALKAVGCQTSGVVVVNVRTEPL